MTTLAYDDLPPGSDIRRVIETDTVRITIPAGEPQRAVIKQAAMDGLVSGAIIAVRLLVLALLIFYQGIRANRLSGAPLMWAWAFFAIFCATMVILIGWLRFGQISDALRLCRQQMTVIAATPQRLVIETSGPFAVAGYDFARDRIAAVAVGRTAINDYRQRLRAVQILELTLSDGRVILLLPGRDPRELKWVCGTIAQVMSLQAA